MKPTLSIIIPSLGRSKNLKDLLNSLKEQETSYFIEILICYTCPEVNITGAIPSMPSSFQIKKIPSPIPGIGTARNLGIKNAVGSVLLFIDEDCSLKSPKDLHFIIETALTNPSEIYAGYYYNTEELSLASQFYNFMCNSWLRRHWGHVVLGGCCFYATDKSLKFPENFKTSGEEYVFCQTAIERKKTITPLFPWGVIHSPNYSWKDILKKAWSQGLTLNARSKIHKSFYTASFLKNTLSPVYFIIPLIAFYFISRSAFIYISLKNFRPFTKI